MFRQVPVLPVVVPLAAVALAALLTVLARRGRLTAPRAAVAVALSGYGAGIVANTVFPIFLDKPRAHAPWDGHLTLVLLSGYQADDALTNVAVFVPLGVLVPLLLARSSWPRTVLVAVGVSLGIEVSQLITAHLLGGGHLADVNDLLFNVLGAALGYGLLRAGARVPRVAALVDRLRWSDPAPTDPPADGARAAVPAVAGAPRRG
ncbi:VanZ family protein [Cellulomonas sp. ACRRI]|uniref:VanZ family protein n=1 Tax=Cellulomonas sp. ACRRI TaxID=2918188 RepID=UPI001EF30A52|nr:VanZ family protein [Cellulomonas sp. ACRRI]MCG7285918.1 VanZ family protein [Cellulomonas sp. ACRRI]